MPTRLVLGVAGLKEKRGWLNIPKLQHCSLLVYNHTILITLEVVFVRNSLLIILGL
jgi:hypothetical protein